MAGRPRTWGTSDEWARFSCQNQEKSYTPVVHLKGKWMLKAVLNKNRKLGVEFEMFLPRLGAASGTDVQNSLAQILSSNGLPAIARSYSSSPLPAGYDFAVEYDTSIQGTWTWNNVPFAPIELKTRILNRIDDFDSKVVKALNICQDLGAKTNSTTGFHLHCGFPEIQENPRHMASLYNLFLHFEPLVFSILAPSRTNNQYCLAISEGKNYLDRCKTMDDYRRLLGNRSRKHGLNLIHLFGSQPHIEFRYHHGTTNPDKARNWVVFCLAMVEHAIRRNIRAMDQLPKSRTNLEKVLIACGFKVNNNTYSQVCSEIRSNGKWLLERFYTFQGKTSLRQEKMLKADPFPPHSLD
jgi:hypothetical protein